MDYTKNEKTDLDYTIIIILIMFWIVPIFHYLMGL
jgi:hypothetical protein